MNKIIEKIIKLYPRRYFWIDFVLTILAIVGYFGDNKLWFTTIQLFFGFPASILIAQGVKKIKKRWSAIE